MMMPGPWSPQSPPLRARKDISSSGKLPKLLRSVESMQPWQEDMERITGDKLELEKELCKVPVRLFSDIKLRLF